eukprot:6176641-Pleurochrysis_carterae.AAC.1
MTVSTDTNSLSQRSGSRRGGWGAPERWLEEGALSRQRRPAREGFQEPEERSASAPRIGMRRKPKTANSACECQIASARRARRQFVSNCRARARVEMVIIWFRGQNENAK